MSQPVTHPCPQCATSLTADQRFCVLCGAEQPAVAPEYAAVWDRLPEPAAPVADAAPEDAATTATAAVAAGGAGRRRPSRSLSGLLVGGTLLAGIVVGAILSPGPSSSSAAGGPPVLVMGSAAPAPTTPAAPPAADTTSVDDTAVDDTAITPEDSAAATDTTTDTGVDTTTDAGTDTSTDTGSTDTGDVGDGSTDLSGDGATDAFTAPKLSHVWVITLAGQDYAALFGPAAATPYLRDTLTPKGALLKHYTPVAGSSAAGGAALLSGQGPNDATTAGCPVYADVTPATVDATTGLAAGTGCLYPKEARTLADQLTDNARTWRAYVQSQGTPCRHPEPGQPDPWTAVTPLNAFLTARNPFVLFHTVIDEGSCADRVADLDALTPDLKDAAKTPSLSWIVPDGLHDGSDVPISDGGVGGVSGVGGPTSTDGFLKSVVPQILATKAYKDDGLLLIVPDSPGPATNGATAIAPTGALALSPSVQAGAIVTTALGPYSLLRSLEDSFGVGHLGHAADEATTALGADVYTAKSTSNTL